MDEEYIGLEEVLQELGISESELRAMITRGQIRAFGKTGEEKFRRNAVEGLKKAAESQPTVLPEDDFAIEEEPLVLDEPEPLAVDEPEPLFVEDDSPTEMPALADDDDFEASDTVMPTIELAADEEPAFVDEEHTEVATQEVSLADEDYLILEEDKAPTSAMGEPAGYQPQEDEEDEEVPEPAAYQEEVTPTPWATALLGLLTLLMLVSLVVYTGAATGKMPAGLRTWVNDNLAGLFLGDNR